MAKNLKDAVALKNARLDAITTYAGTSAKLRIYTGSQPADPDTAIGAVTLLSEHICNGTAFAAAAAAGVLTANAIANATAVGTGTAAWFRIWKSNGTTPVYDGTVGTGGTFDCVLDNTSINTGQVVSITALTRTAGN
jgi:hypothetical protein